LLTFVTIWCYECKKKQIFTSVLALGASGTCARLHATVFSGLVKNFSSFLKLLGRVVRLYYEITQRERSQRLDGFQLQV
jgi:hypothetical protein